MNRCILERFLLLCMYKNKHLMIGTQSLRLVPMWQQSGTVTLLFDSCHRIARFLVD